MKRGKILFVLEESTNKEDFEKDILNKYPFLRKDKKIYCVGKNIQFNNERYHPTRIFIQKSAGLNILIMRRLLNSLNVFEIDI